MNSVASPATLAPTASSWARLAVSNVHGSGLYATKPIPKGTQVIEYVGERITKKEAMRRDDARLDRQDEGADGCVYIFEVDEDYDIDGDVSWNTARLINHSCEPNCETINIRGHIWISALRDIEEEEELNYDYGFEWSVWEDHPCRCGAPSCVGYIVKIGQGWRVRRVLEQRAKK